MVLDSITYTDREQSKKKSQTQYGISWNPEYHATNNCTNSHMSLSQKPLPVDDKCEPKKKKKEGYRWELNSTICTQFTRKWRDILMDFFYWTWIRRD